MKKNFRLMWLLCCACLLAGCSSDVIEDATDVVNVERKPINRAKVGVNAFGNDQRFGSLSAQYREVRDTLGIGFVRVLIGWDDKVQPSPSGAPDFSFYDELLSSIPDGVDVLAVVTHIPTWMENRENWIDGDPRKTFVERWIRPVASRYASQGKLSAIQVWNEPNAPENPENAVMGMLSNPEQYVSMLRLANDTIDAVAPGKRVVNAATTAINQNFPSSLDYNKAMVRTGILDVIDIFAIHYYGRQFERVVVDDGVADFLNALGKNIWVTESGSQGVNTQLAYVEEAWPFLDERISGIQRFYYYQFTESTPAESTYGLRNLSTEMPVSDLYVSLRDR